MENIVQHNEKNELNVTHIIELGAATELTQGPAGASGEWSSAGPRPQFNQ